MDWLKEYSLKFIKFHSSHQYCELCPSNMSRKRRLKYIGAIGKHGFAVKLEYSTEAINLIRSLGCLLKMDYLADSIMT